MKTLSLDIETFASADLSHSGVYRYAESRTLVLLLGYSADGGTVEVDRPASGRSAAAGNPRRADGRRRDKWAFNANFERVCLSGGWVCPRRIPEPGILALLHGVGGGHGAALSLEGAGAALGLTKQKLSEGKELIRFFCHPARRQNNAGAPATGGARAGEVGGVQGIQPPRRGSGDAVQERLSRFRCRMPSGRVPVGSGDQRPGRAFDANARAQCRALPRAISGELTRCSKR